MSLPHWLKPLAVIAAVATVTAIGPPAGAADSYKLLPSGSGKKACPLGYVCLWEGSEFTGRGVATFALCKGEAMAYLDIARSDGAIPGKGWQKEISSHQFTGISHCAG